MWNHIQADKQPGEARSVTEGQSSGPGLTDTEGNKGNDNLSDKAPGKYQLIVFISWVLKLILTSY